MRVRPSVLHKCIKRFGIEENRTSLFVVIVQVQRNEMQFLRRMVKKNILG